MIIKIKNHYLLNKTEQIINTTNTVFCWFQLIENTKTKLAIQHIYNNLFNIKKAQSRQLNITNNYILTFKHIEKIMYQIKKIFIKLSKSSIIQIYAYRLIKLKPLLSSQFILKTLKKKDIFKATIKNLYKINIFKYLYQKKQG